ncbi:flagellar biosynthetic protein FliR [Scandinavium sp. H11S7]|uniref:flagellar biosynthetic protein FliR n=1 Tax=Scandinavium hiltneri TaxID=2926519 RepID=UPI0021653EF6|nr:flagellar biosynthetic protein FliR [Scandinavium hiltneri]MCS2158090.1 flagellar biosynthetic protein FliR [Scandinavium hiltneri]
MGQTDIVQFTNLVLGMWFPFVRIMTFFQFSPVFQNHAFTIRVRIMLSGALTLIITPMIPHPIPDQLVTTMLLTLEQFIWGMLFGMMLQLVFQVLQMAGQILSFNMGMSMATMNDPNSGTNIAVLGEFINIFAILLFFIMDGHLLLVSILYKGFTYWPIGHALTPQSLMSVAMAFTWVLSSAILLALPTTFIMLVVQMCFGLLNRISPSLNLYSLGFPINMLAGLVCFAALMYSVPDHYMQLVNEVLHQLDKLKVAHG